MIHPSSAPTIPPGFASHALQLLQRVQHGISPVELVYTAHERWPLRPGQSAHTRPTLRVSVLDASFNPPTRAHLALANSPPPSSSQFATTPQRYDAQMLLLSVRNVDKVIKPGDATFVQRLEMMRLLSHDIHFIGTTGESKSLQTVGGNVAVAIINEPTFVRKSTHLLHFLQTRLASFNYSSNDISVQLRDASRPCPSPKLTFLLGSDTLTRLFSPKYYSSEQAMVQMLRAFLSPNLEDCHIVCAYRGGAHTDGVFDVGHEFIKSHRIAFINIGADERTYSSSEVRAKIAEGDGGWRQLVTDKIADYIAEQRVYLSAESERER